MNLGGTPEDTLQQVRPVNMETGGSNDALAKTQEPSKQADDSGSADMQDDLQSFSDSSL